MVNPTMEKAKCPYVKPFYMIIHYMKRGRFPAVFEEELALLHKKIPMLLCVGPAHP
jgi:hypothetical protein